jgi:hypothetical protein
MTADYADQRGERKPNSHHSRRKRTASEKCYQKLVVRRCNTFRDRLQERSAKSREHRVRNLPFIAHKYETPIKLIIYRQRSSSLTQD